MNFYAVLDEIRTLLQRRGRVTYRALKVQFHLDAEHLEALKEELIEAEQLAVDEKGKVLVWTGAPASAPPPASLPATAQEQAPLSYTPQYLAAEAISHLTKGLEVLKTLPDTHTRAQQELGLQNTLGPVLMAIKGWAAPEVEATYARAHALCQQVGETPQLFPALMGIGTFYMASGKLQTARELREQLLSLAQRQQEPVPLLHAHLALGATLLWLGELAQARVHLEHGIRLYDQNPSHSPSFAGDDPGVSGRRLVALVLWLLGYSDQALRRSHEALTLAQALSQPFSLAFALAHAALLHQFRYEAQAAQERAEAGIALAREQGFARWEAWGTIDNDVAPDVVWISQARRATALGPEGHLHAAPELVVEVLSPGEANECRDREAKLKLYSRRGVLEYWIVDWRTQQIEVYRREQLALRLVATLYPTDTLTSPLLPEFVCQVATLF